MINIDLEETRVYGLNERWKNPNTKEDALDLMQILYLNILIHDPYWHFFWEGHYTVIRHSPDKHYRLKELIKLNDPDDELTVVHKLSGYQENIETTKRYLGAFIPIFHGYSVLAMELDNQDFIPVLERINHCFLNMVTRDAIVEEFDIDKIMHGKTINIHQGMGWEGLAISMVANIRLWTAGWYRGHHRKVAKYEDEG